MSLMLYAAVAAEPPTNTPRSDATITEGTSISTANERPLDPTKQDGRFIEKLQWVSPNGELPATYADYLSVHPLTPARFSPPQYERSQDVRLSKNIALLVDNEVYPAITTQLNQYISDLQSETYSIWLQTITGGTPEEIKTWITNRYDNGTNGIE